jgi:hypothetical protein
MSTARRKTFWRRLRQRLGATLTLAGYLAATFGIPLPAPAIRKNATVPFPCQDHPCGCQTAEQCWTRCCCMTAEERWEWAAAHNIQPPDYAERPVSEYSGQAPEPTETAAGWRTTPCRHQGNQDPPARPRRSCCREQSAQDGTVPIASVCCAPNSRGQSCCKQQPTLNPREGATSPRPGRRAVPSMSALGCQGLTALGAYVGVTVRTALAIAWTPRQGLDSWIISSDESALTLAQSPPAPPPR